MAARIPSRTRAGANRFMFIWPHPALRAPLSIQVDGERACNYEQLLPDAPMASRPGAARSLRSWTFIGTVLLHHARVRAAAQPEPATRRGRRSFPRKQDLAFANSAEAVGESPADHVAITVASPFQVATSRSPW